ncbi:MAG TPA: acyltransferase [Isosphaeraceae bacterium]
MRRIPELDAVRGIAAVVIVLFHWRFHVPLLATAVDLFFVLSGYLITAILLETAGTRHAFRTFYARRALRIFPIYYLTFAVFVVINRGFARPHPLDALPYFLTYTQFIQGYWGGSSPPCSRAFGHTWTLAIEEQFYLVWPLVVRATGRRGLLILGPPLLALPAALRFAGLDPHLLLTRCDGLVLGAVLAALLADRRWRERHRSTVGIALAVGAVAAAVPVAGLAEGPTWGRIAAGVWLSRIGVIYACAVGLVVVHAGRPALRPLRARWLGAIGRRSYGLYLYHTPVFLLVRMAHDRLGLHAPMLRDLTKLAALWAVAGLSWRYVERPLLALKDRMAYGPPRAPAGAGAEGPGRRPDPPHGPPDGRPAVRPAQRSGWPAG